MRGAAAAPERLRDRLGRRNNFDAVRLAAASAVVLSHAFPLSYGNNAAEPLFVWSHEQMTLGSLAVRVFFVVSGFLITYSFLRSPTFASFVFNRALRILPGLFVMVLVLTLLLGPLVTTLPLREYLAHPDFGAYWTNVLPLRPHYVLPGVFEENPYPRAVNGVIWTLKYEMLFYGVTAALGLTRLLRRDVVLLVLVLCLLLPRLADLPGERYVAMFSCYCAGAALFLWRDRVRLRPSFALFALAALALASRLGGLHETFALAGSYLVVYVAFAPSIPLQGAGRAGDFSYGLYIYGFPLQQAVVLWAGSGIGWGANLALSFPLALACAAASWHLVERPALRLKASSLRAW